MFERNYGAIQYIDRERVLRHLLQIMIKELLPKERQMIFLRCGLAIAEPMEFDQLAARFQLGTPVIAEEYYNKAIQKTRAAIPGSKLEKLISGYKSIG